MLEAKNYRHVNYAFPIIAAFIDRIREERHCMTGVITMLYNDVLDWVL